MPSMTLTQAATAAAQFLGVLDSGETLSAQQLTDALNAANNLLQSWYQEQALAMQELITEQAKAGLSYVAQQVQTAAVLTTAYTLVAGNYTNPTYLAPVFTPSVIPQFSDNTTPITIPNGYPRALQLGLAIELGPQYDIEPSAALVKNYTEARAAASPMPGKVPIPGMSAQSEVQA